LRAVVQRVSEARVLVDGDVVAEVGAGMCVLIGFDVSDAEPDLAGFARKVAHLRIFVDAEGRMTSSVLDTKGSALVVSQFTLIADTVKGNRPSFSHAARPEQAEALYEAFCEALLNEGVHVARGVFGARMQVALVNDGPVTIVLEPKHAAG
jgi:D-tyrosyl-tRNA(Tyr) deacylase